MARARVLRNPGAPRGVRLGVRLQGFFPAQIILQPRRQHRARRQAGHTHEGDDVRGLCVRQDFLEIRMRVAFDRNGEWRADLHRGGAERQQCAHFVMSLDPARHDQRNSFALDAKIAQQFKNPGEHGLEVEARIVDVLGTCRAEI